MGIRPRLAVGSGEETMVAALRSIAILMMTMIGIGMVKAMMEAMTIGAKE